MGCTCRTGMLSLLHEHARSVTDVVPQRDAAWGQSWNVAATYILSWLHTVC